ncbi:protein-S-isoprenylcysteine O-methyltransferase Ste14 [Ulvibacter sp. MAR_2010_11]|uniref:methyltransferase family protein n=1 Tax=Ulvibacter sp. MAR_2010_11 TaxID=1250229 RepID=UPI000CBF78E1|nr:isoprenylcysteine carboxylmethyltransferase family protein [Ulvibacter sp. MAR_2010_11]PKA83831.1 protein-S-isoprenylcysteine O-methyltransferase Ste14 [Ulvibacter sp. MAR_2010_11]
MKKDIFYLLVQFILFTLFFINWEDNLGLGIPGWVDYFFFIVIGFGLLVILFGIINLNENATLFSTASKKSNIVFRGIYKYVRHPIYLGLIIAMMAFSLYSQSVAKLLLMVALSIAFYLKSRHEEKLLEKTFSNYKQYKAKTGRFFPKRNDSAS